MIASQADPQVITSAEALLSALEFYPPSETLAVLAARLRAAVEQSRSTAEAMFPFESQFQPVPNGKVSGGHLEVGEFDGSSYTYETDVEFLLGPDGNVWAKIGTLDDIPDEQPANEDDDNEHGNPLVFVTHRGITVYHCWHGECLSENWYTTDPDDADIDYGGDAQFDVRDLPPALPVGDDGRADHRGRMMAAIDAGLITAGGYINPADLARCDYCGEVTDSTHGHYWPGEGGPGSKWECDGCQAQREAHAEEANP